MLSVLRNFILVCLSLATCLAQKSFWATAVPHTTTTDDAQSVNLGIRFHTTVPGAITSIKFYKGAGNTGPHTVVLWGGSTKLVSVDTTAETADGWQVVRIPSTRIQANTDYVASYLARTGHYADDQGYNWAGLRSSPLLPSGTSPGIFAYSTGVAIPTESWNLSNYWVDVVFMPDMVVTPGTHSVTLNWTASTSPNIAGYRVYRGSAPGGPYTEITTRAQASTNFVDKAVSAGSTYYYVCVAVDTAGNQSKYSNEARAVVPSP